MPLFVREPHHCDLLNRSIGGKCFAHCSYPDKKKQSVLVYDALIFQRSFIHTKGYQSVEGCSLLLNAAHCAEIVFVFPSDTFKESTPNGWWCKVCDIHQSENRARMPHPCVCVCLNPLANFLPHLEPEFSTLFFHGQV